MRSSLPVRRVSYLVLAAFAAPMLSAPWPLELRTAVLQSAQPNPPHLIRSDAAMVRPGAARPAADPAEWVVGELTDQEQKILELINRARANPKAEADRLKTLPDADVQGAYVGFGVDLNLFAADMAGRAVVPPLTPHAQLTEAARGHTQYQFDNAVQSHSQIDFDTGTELNGIDDRATAVGYDWRSLRESVYSYAYNMEHAHAGFEVDWGFGPGGQQSPPGHRNNNHDVEMAEIGLGVLDGTKTVVRPDSTNTVGPKLVTLNFALPSTRRNYVTGVAYFDLNSDGEYDEGEGLPGVRVEVSGATQFARTSRSGGYGVPASDGIRTVTLSGPGLASVTRSVTLRGGSVKVDLALPYAAPLLEGPAKPAVGFANAYQPAVFPSATSYEWRAVSRPSFVTVLGAEAGVDGFVQGTTGTYIARTKASRSAGLASYRLVNATAVPQTLTQTSELLSAAAATVRFKWRFGFSTPDSTAAVEISTDGGSAWREVWLRSGLGVGIIPGATFQEAAIPLNLAANTAFKLRFRLAVRSGGSFYNDETDERVGFFFDELAYTDVSEVIPAGGGEVPAGGLVLFTPSMTGPYLLQARPKIGSRIYPYREGVTVTAQTGGPIPVTTRITTAVIGPNGKLKIEFSVLSGTAGGFDLEHAQSLGGTWTRDGAAVLSTNAPGQLVFRSTPTGALGFWRIRAK